MSADTSTDFHHERFRHWEQRCACDCWASFGLPCIAPRDKRVVYTTTEHAPKCLRCGKEYQLIAESVNFVSGGRSWDD